MRVRMQGICSRGMLLERVGRGDSGEEAVLWVSREPWVAGQSWQEKW